MQAEIKVSNAEAEHLGLHMKDAWMHAITCEDGSHMIMPSDHQFFAMAVYLLKNDALPAKPI